MVTRHLHPKVSPLDGGRRRESGETTWQDVTVIGRRPSLWKGGRASLCVDVRKFYSSPIIIFLGQIIPVWSLLVKRED